eukprot:COSAG02_NODE_1818_length_10774_cov_4.788009_7_plen_599_part_00
MQRAAGSGWRAAGSASVYGAPPVHCFVGALCSGSGQCVCAYGAPTFPSRNRGGGPVSAHALAGPVEVVWRPCVDSSLSCLGSNNRARAGSAGGGSPAVSACTLRSTADKGAWSEQVEPEPEPEPEPNAVQSCLKAIGLITGTGGRAAKLISWFPADGSTAASGALGVAKHAQIAAPSVAADSKSSKLQDEELEWFGLPREELASLLAPAAALCDTDFDLQVDALRFIGRPTIIGGANSIESNESGATRNTELAQFNVGDAEHVSPRRKRIDSQSSSKRLGEQDESTPVEYSGGGWDEGQEPGGERRRLNTRSNSQELLGKRQATRTNSQKLLEIREKEAKRIFHVVFVIDSHKLTGRQGESVKAWQTLAARLTSALLLEERRCGYIAEEIATMRRLREEHSSQASPAAIGEKSGSGSVTDSGAAIDRDTTKDTPKPLAQQFLEHSDLARVLEMLYRGLVSPAGGAGVLINGWIRLDLYVESAQGTRSVNSSNAAIRLRQEPEQVHPHQTHRHRHQIDPEQSYMLLRPKQVLLAELPAYASPAVRAAIEHANPCLSVYTLAESMYISVERLVTVCAFLCDSSLFCMCIVASRRGQGSEL